MAMVLDSKTDLSFPYWTSVRRPFGPDSSFFATGNLERELLAKQIQNGGYCFELQFDGCFRGPFCVIKLIFILLQSSIQGKMRGLGKDYTTFSLIDGLVKFEKFGPDKKKVSVYPREAQPENPNSYRARKREYLRMRRERRKAKQGGIVAQPELVLASAADATYESQIC